MLTFAASIFLLLVNCAPSSQGLKDNELKPFVNRFSVVVDTFGYKVQGKILQSRVIFGKTEPKNIAECYAVFNEIIINKESFDKLPIENKEELIFHELGHCVLNKLHIESGIMKPSGFYNPVYYRNNYSSIMNEFLTRGENSIDIQYEDYTTQGKTMSKKEEILANEHAVVRFTADWCGPCKQMKPIFEEVALANPTVKVYVIDVDKDSDTTVDFGVKGIPTLIKIVDKAEQVRTVGGQTKEKIEELFRK